MANENVKSYLRNLGSSVSFIAKSTIKNEMPMLIGTYEKNEQTFSSGANYVRNFVSSKGSGVSSSASSMMKGVFKDIGDIGRNAFSDLKTGKIKNFDRQMQSFGESMKMGSWGDNWDPENDGSSNNNSLFNLDDDDDHDQTEFSYGEELKSNLQAATRISELGSNLRTKATIGAIVDSSGKSTQDLMSNSKKLASLQMGLMSQMHTDTIKSMNDTNSLLQSMVEFNNNQITSHMDKTLSFYDNTLTELRAIKESLNRKEETYEHKSSQYEDVFGYSGLDFKKYAQAVKQNFNNWLSSTPIGMGMAMSKMTGGPLNDIKSSPISFFLDLMMSGLMPRSMKMVMGNLDKSVTGLLSSTILKLNGMRNTFGSTISNIIGNVFGLDLNARSNIDVGRFHRGAMQYNGRANKAITEVIPSLLSNILSAVRGDNTVKIYNYDTGRFVDSANIKKDHTNRINNSTIYGYRDVRNAMKNNITKVAGNNQFLIDEMDTLLQFITKRGTHFNPRTENDVAKLISEGLKLNDSRSYSILRQAILSAPKSIQNRLQSEIINSIKEKTGTIKTIEREIDLNGLGSAYNELSGPPVPGAKEKRFFSTTNNILRNIQNILIQGIKVLPIGQIKGSPSDINSIINRKLVKTQSSESSNNQSPKSSTSSSSNKNETENILNMTSEQLKNAMKESSTVDPGPSFSRFVESILQEKTIGGKFKVIKNGMKPSNLMSKVGNKLDSFFHMLIYGKGESEDNAEGDSSASNSFYSRVTQRLSNAIDKSVKWVDSKVLSPLHAKFFGEDGVFTKFRQSMEPFIDKLKAGVKTGYSKFKDLMVGSKNNDGFFTGGILSDLQNSFMDHSNQIRHFFTGSAYKKSDGTEIAANKTTSVMSYVRNYSKGIMETVKTGLLGDKIEVDEIDPATGQLKKTVKRKGDGLFNKVTDELKSMFKSVTSIFKTKENETDEDRNNAVNQWKKEIKGFIPKGIAGGVLGAVSSMVLPGGPLLWGFVGSSMAFAQHSNKFRQFIFGTDDQRGIVPPSYVKAMKEVKANLPSIAAGGILGVGADILLPIPGGWATAFTLGSAIGYAKNSTKVQKWLFGETDNNGNLIRKGIFSPTLKNDLKKYVPASIAGGILGVGADILLPIPGGWTTAFALGSSMAFASKSKRVQDWLFGTDSQEGKIPKKWQETFKKFLPNAAKGAIWGSLSHLLFGSIIPGGPVVGAMMGAAISIASTSERFKQMLFGEEDPTTKKRKGGLFGRISEPFMLWAGKKGLKMKNWFQDTIGTPVKNLMRPLGDAFSIIGKRLINTTINIGKFFGEKLMGALNLVVGKGIGEPTKNFMRDVVFKNLKRMVTGAGKGLAGATSGAIRTPLKLINWGANKVIEHDEIDQLKKKYGPLWRKYYDGYKYYDMDTGERHAKGNLFAARLYERAKRNVDRQIEVEEYEKSYYDAEERNKNINHEIPVSNTKSKHSDPRIKLLPDNLLGDDIESSDNHEIPVSNTKSRKKYSRKEKKNMKKNGTWNGQNKSDRKDYLQLFSADETIEKSNRDYMKKIYNEMDRLRYKGDKWYKKIPQILLGAGIGAASYYVLPFNPVESDGILATMTLGGTISYLSSMKMTKEWLFGKRDANGNLIERGKISEDIQNFVKKYGIGIGQGALKGLKVAALAHFPGMGLLSSLAIGSVLGGIYKIDGVQKFLYGDTDEKGNIIKKGILGKHPGKTKFPIFAGITAAIAESLLPIPGIGLTTAYSLGSLGGFLYKTNRVQEFLYGSFDNDGNMVKQGILGDKFKSFVKKYIPNAILGGAIGLGANWLLPVPGGVTSSIIIGSAVTTMVRSKKINEILFGNEEKDGLIPKKFREMVKKKFPGTASFAGMGALGSLIFSNSIGGGMLTWATAFAALRLIGTSETLRDKISKPIGHWGSRLWIKFDHWFEDAIKNPLRNAMKPVGKALRIIGSRMVRKGVDLGKTLVDSVKNSVKDTFNKIFGGRMGQWMTKWLFKPIGNFFGKMFEKSKNTKIGQFFGDMLGSLFPKKKEGEGMMKRLTRGVGKGLKGLGKGITSVMQSPAKILTTAANKVIEDEEIRQAKAKYGDDWKDKWEGYKHYDPITGERHYKYDIENARKEHRANRKNELQRKLDEEDEYFMRINPHLKPPKTYRNRNNSDTNDVQEEIPTSNTGKRKYKWQENSGYQSGEHGFLQNFSDMMHDMNKDKDDDDDKSMGKISRSIKGFSGKLRNKRLGGVMGRIMVIDNMAGNITHRHEYKAAEIGLMHEIAVSNVQILDAIHSINGDKQNSLLGDLLKGLLTKFLSKLKSLPIFSKNNSNTKSSSGGNNTTTTTTATSTNTKSGGGTIVTPNTTTKSLPEPTSGKPPLLLPGQTSSSSKPNIFKRFGNSVNNLYTKLTKGYSVTNGPDGKPIIDIGGGTPKTSTGSKLLGGLKNVGKGTMSTVGKVGKAVGPLGIILSTLSIGSSLLNFNNAQNDDEKNAAGKNVFGAIGSSIGGILGGMGAGAVAGAALGIETGPGALLTGLAGAIVGGFIGEAGMKKLYEKVNIKEIKSSIMNTIGNAKDGIVNFANSIGDDIKDKSKRLSNFVTTTANSVKTTTKNTIDSAGTAIKNAWDNSSIKAGLQDTSKNINNLGNWVSKNIFGNHASGLDTVPYDNYKANLHKGEMVVPANQANMMRVMSGMKPVIPSNAKGPINNTNHLVNSIPALSKNLLNKIRNAEIGGGDPAYQYVHNNSGSNMTDSDIEMIKQLSKKYGIDTNLWLALVETESNFNSNAANSKSTAKGWGQILDGTARDIYQNKLKKGLFMPYMSFNKQINAEMSMYYLSSLLKQFNGNIEKAVLAYNVGPGNVLTGNINKFGAGSGSDYVKKVLKNLKENTGKTFADIGYSTNMYTTGTASNSTSGYQSTSSDSSDDIQDVGELGRMFGDTNLKTKFGFNFDDLTGGFNTRIAASGAFALYDKLFGKNSDDDADSNTPYQSSSDYISTYSNAKFDRLGGDADVHAFFAQRLNNIAKAYGKTLSINSGWRTDSEQQSLINKWRREHPGASEAERKKYVADPGVSNHGIGIAADISGWIQTLSDSELEQYGLWRPMSYEPWHFEPIETKRYGRSRSRLTPMFGTPANPASNINSYLDPRFNNQVGGGDPNYAPNPNQYTEKVRVANNVSKESNNTPQLDKIISILTTIAKYLENISSTNSESSEYLKQFIETVAKQNPTSTDKQSVAILQNSGSTPTTTPINTAAARKNSKSAVIAQIAKGTY